MTSPISDAPIPVHATHPESVEMPLPTAAPIVLASGIALLGTGFVLSPTLLLVGLVLLIVGLTSWIRQLLPGRGHAEEPLVEPALRPQPVAVRPASVERLRVGMAGYRLVLPQKVHPISSGVKGGIVGGLVMPVPALAYGILSGHGPWYPINLLAGFVIPGISGATQAELEQFYFGALILGIIIHAAFSVSFGLYFGVVSPTLPPLPGGPVIAGGVLMPLVWSGICYGFMGIVNPLLEERVNWLWFIISQMVYGLVMSIVVVNTQKVPASPVGSGPPPGAEMLEPNPEGSHP
jgi:hypothetical protein